MQSSLYVALSAQMALQRRLDTIANNVANVSTAGFRAEEVKFETAVSPNTPEPVAFAKLGEPQISRKAGEVVKTGNAFDVAVKGDAWLAIQTEAGAAYTRDGRFRMTATGDLQTLNGYPVLDVGGAPIQLDARGSEPAIANDGMISQSGRQVGALGLFVLEDGAKLTRFENSAVIPDKPAIPVLDLATERRLLCGFSR